MNTKFVVKLNRIGRAAEWRAMRTGVVMRSLRTLIVGVMFSALVLPLAGCHREKSSREIDVRHGDRETKVKVEKERIDTHRDRENR